MLCLQSIYAHSFLNTIIIVPFSAGTSRPASSYIADMREVGSASVPNRTGWADEEEEEEEEYNSDLSLSKLSSAPVH